MWWRRVARSLRELADLMQAAGARPCTCGAGPAIYGHPDGEPTRCVLCMACGLAPGTVNLIEELPSFKRLRVEEADRLARMRKKARMIGTSPARRLIASLRQQGPLAAYMPAQVLNPAQFFLAALDLPGRVTATFRSGAAFRRWRHGEGPQRIVGN